MQAFSAHFREIENVRCSDFLISEQTRHRSQKYRQRAEVSNGLEHFPQGRSRALKVGSA